MHKYNNNVAIKKFGFICGTVALIIGILAFAISWLFWQSGMPGYSVFLLPGNLFLQLFTEELDFGLKLTLLLFGQFFVTALVAMAAMKIKFRLGKCNNVN